MSGEERLVGRLGVVSPPVFWQEICVPERRVSSPAEGSVTYLPMESLSRHSHTLHLLSVSLPEL